MFSDMVALYRAIGSPAIKDNVACYEGVLTAKIDAALKACAAIQPQFGKIQLCEEIGDGEVEVELRLPANEYGCFYASMQDMARRGTLGKGIFPQNVYVMDLDWADFDPVEPTPVTDLKRVCRLVQLMAALAVGVDRDSNPNAYNLFFALPPDSTKPPKTFLLPTLIDEKFIGYKIHHLSLLEEILNSKNENKAHLSERKLMIRMAVASVIEKFESEPQHFLVLVREWHEVLATYRANLQTYVYGFSFEKARRELAQAEIDYATKLSAVLGDIAGKMLALPVSFAGWLALAKSDSFFEDLVLVSGLVVVSLVMFSILHNQTLQATRLLHSFSVVFDEFKGKMKTYPIKLQGLLRMTVEQVETQGRTLWRTFTLLKILAILPGAVAIAMVVIKYWDSPLGSFATIIVIFSAIKNSISFSRS